MRSLVAIDSNALTYLVEAIEPGYDPAADDPVLAAERIAMIRTYLYAGVQFWIMPTVELEYNRIRDPSRHLRHQRAPWILLHDAPVHAPGNGAGHLTGFHGGVEDCRIVAEAEASGVATLVTRDDDLIANLGPHTRLVLQYPSAFWASLGIPRGSTPHLEPSPSNPLAHVSWCRL